MTGPFPWLWPYGDASFFRSETGLTEGWVLGFGGNSDGWELGFEVGFSE